jgi:hypothetical protein
MGTNFNIRFNQEGLVTEIISSIRLLKKENNREVIYTGCGLRIDLDHVESINGIYFS